MVNHQCECVTPTPARSHALYIILSCYISICQWRVRVRWIVTWYWVFFPTMQWLKSATVCYPYLVSAHSKINTEKGLTFPFSCILKYPRLTVYCSLEDQLLISKFVRETKRNYKREVAVLVFVFKCEEICRNQLFISNWVQFWLCVSNLG